MATPTRPDVQTATQMAPARFIQCRIPTELYEWMRLQGFLTRRSMNSIALGAVETYRAEVEAGRSAPERGRPAPDAAVKYNVRVGDPLYEWLRTTAFHTRTSINALVGAALAQSHAAHDGEARP